MNPKNIEQYVVKSVIAYMDLETKLKQENEMLKKRLEFLEYVYYRLNDYENLCLNCSIEGCKALDMSEIREHLVYHCEFVKICDSCDLNFCDSHGHETKDSDGWIDGFICESCFDESKNDK